MTTTWLPSLEKLPTSSLSSRMALVATAASVTTAVILFGYQGSQRKRRVRHLEDGRTPPQRPTPRNDTNFDNHSGSDSVPVCPAPRQIQEQSERAGDKNIFDEDLVAEQLARNISFLGEAGVQKLRDSFVVIVGAGGVGSWTATMLIKSGVGRIRIIDFDQITLSGLNQHATATRADVGTPKAVAMKKYFKTISPWVEVDVRVERLQGDSIERLLSGKPDYIVDAVGDLESKLQLLKYCHDNNIPAMSALGAGAKADPSRIQIGDISETFEDPSARAIRCWLKKMGIDTGIGVVFSSEKPKLVTKQCSLEDQGSDVNDGNDNGYACLPNLDLGVELPVLGSISAMFGMSMATFIICKIAGWATEPFPVKFRMELYQRLHRDLKTLEGTLQCNAATEHVNMSMPLQEDAEDIPLTRRDVGYIVEEMFRGRSAISQSMDKIALCRWKQQEPLSLYNVVVLTECELEKHIKLARDVDLAEVYGDRVINCVERIFHDEEQT
ncbi:hypothetical protein BGZ98_008072, partial [Dissophora globulifera]